MYDRLSKLPYISYADESTDGSTALPQWYSHHTATMFWGERKRYMDGAEKERQRDDDNCMNNMELYDMNKMEI